MKEKIKMLVVLSVIAGASGLCLAAIKEATKNRIELQIIEYEVKPTLKALFTYDNDPVAERKKIGIEVMDKKTGEKKTVTITVFPIKVKGKLENAAFERYGKGGYGGDVGVLAGFYLEEGKTDRLAGIGITANKETPGIGSRVKDSAFTNQFKDKPFDKVKLGAGIDGVTGATRSSTAVVDGTWKATEIYRNNLKKIKEAFK